MQHNPDDQNPTIHFLPKPMKNKTNYSSTSSQHSSFSKLQSLSRSGNSSLLRNL